MPVRVITNTQNSNLDYYLAREICVWLCLPTIQCYNGQWDFYDEGGRYRAYVNVGASVN